MNKKEQLEKGLEEEEKRALCYSAGTWMALMPNQGCQMVCFQTKNPNLG
jgi:hypothetical protein